METCTCGKKEFFPLKMKTTVNGFERGISFQTGYVCEIDFRGPNAGRSHGVHGMNMLFLLKGERGVVQFLVYTGWLPNYGKFGKDYEPSKPLPTDIGYHAYEAQYNGQESRPDCPHLEGKPCFYDGSGIQADEVFGTFVSKGEEAMWTEMEAFYRRHFEHEKQAVDK